MSKSTTIFIAPVPESPEERNNSAILPCEGSLWGEVSGEINAARLKVERSKLPFGKIIYTACNATGVPLYKNGSRKLVLAHAATMFDIVELQFGIDTTPDVLLQIPVQTRMISLVLAPTGLEHLLQQFGEMAAVEAKFYKVVVRTEKSGAELLPLALLKQLGRKDVIAYATGPIGAWTRLVAPQFGAPAVYTTLGEVPLADGAFPISVLQRDYGFPEVPAFQYLYGIAGNPVFRSLSPRLHNAAYRQMAFPALFVPFHIEDFDHFLQGVVQSPLHKMLGIEIKGLTVVSPFKEAGYHSAQNVVQPIAHITQSCNLMARGESDWISDSTDPLAIVEAFKRLAVNPNGLRAAVIGCGGAGRAIAATLLSLGAQVSLYNRTAARGALASQQLNIPFSLLQHLEPESFDILVNATPLGKNGIEHPFDPDKVKPDAVFIDYAYGKHTTPVIAALRRRGIGCIDGREVLIIQVRRQFEVMTGAIMSETLALKQAFDPEGDQPFTVSSKSMQYEGIEI